MRVWHALWLERIDRKSADLRQRQAEAERGRARRPPAPQCILELVLATGQPLAVHAGDCGMAGRRRRPVGQDDARRLLTTDPVPACPVCRPDTEHIVGLAALLRSATSLATAPAASPATSLAPSLARDRTILPGFAQVNHVFPRVVRRVCPGWYCSSAARQPPGCSCWQGAGLPRRTPASRAARQVSSELWDARATGRWTVATVRPPARGVCGRCRRTSSRERERAYVVGWERQRLGERRRPGNGAPVLRTWQFGLRENVPEAGQVSRVTA
ncbi:DUF6233 domain-containing protein [Streptomyces sp. NPDC127079]|uniref:DUF6233 domain-containing protein n=1 Tax=Streptomyces sp. NPDC127079 TaxID=3347132 RepID=UPI0036635780